MVRVAPVRLQYNPKVLWFDPGDLDIEDGDGVIVKTEKGVEFGTSQAPIEVDDNDIAQLKTKLKPVMRIATDDDFEELENLRAKGKEAMPVFKRLAAEHNEDMRPVMVEYLFGGDKAVFYFESENRIDFRELVRALASELSVRVDMRQIGVRDEARLVGGLGHCGQELCCKRLGGEFNPVSIRMAKEQDLSLNPTKISGLCGRLMCCLRYEYEAYKDFKGRAPKINAKIDTPCGTCKVCELDCPRETVTVYIEEESEKKGKKVTFPLAAMDEPEEGLRPSSIGEVFEEYANPDPFAGTSLGSFDTAGFTREDQLAEPVAKHNPSHKAKEEGQETGKKRRRRRRGGAKKDAQAQAPSKDTSSSQQEASPARRKRRRRRSGSSGDQMNTPASQSAVRPGQKSSSLKRTHNKPQHAPTGETAHRKTRRRSHKSGAAKNSGGNDAV